MKTLLKIAACWLGSIVALLAAQSLIFILKMQPLHPPVPLPLLESFSLAALGGLLLVCLLFPLASGLVGSVEERYAVLFGFLFLALGVNGTLEARAFTSVVRGAVPASLLMDFLFAAIVGGLMAAFLGGSGEPAGLVKGGLAAGIGRVVLALLAFPVIWFLFGMAVGPVVAPAYRAGMAGLHIPLLRTILKTELLRSALFLIASLPVIALWRRSAMRLWATLGLALATVTGYYGLVQATFLPWPMRVAHTLEITADSFAYAGVVILLFARRVRPAPAPVEPAARTPKVHA